MSTYLDQIKVALQQGLSAVAYVGNTTPPMIRTAVTSVLTNVTAVHASVQNLPTSDIGITQIMAVVPKGISLAVATSRTTSSLKTLTSPLTPDDGIAILATLQTARDQIIAAINDFIIRIPAVEKCIPGLSQFSLTTLQSLVNDLTNHFVNAAPSSTFKSGCLEIQASIDAAIVKALAKIPA